MTDVAALRALHEAATDGLWHEWHRTEDGPAELRAGWEDENLSLGYLNYRADAALIAAARNALPELLAAAEAVERVRALHVRSDWYGLDGSVTPGCAACEVETDYPCPTGRALGGKQVSEKLPIIGQERALIDAFTKALYSVGRQTGAYTPIRDTLRGNYFEVRLNYGRIARVTVELDRVESGGEQGE